MREDKVAKKLAKQKRCYDAKVKVQEDFLEANRLLLVESTLRVEKVYMWI
jgi:hypothetical protein